jgi:hypothetical protein
VSQRPHRLGPTFQNAAETSRLRRLLDGLFFLDSSFFLPQ